MLTSLCGVDELEVVTYVMHPSSTRAACSRLTTPQMVVVVQGCSVRITVPYVFCMWYLVYLALR